ncbi:hypothetical protein MMC19_005032 [Ptychographa xylographoides]|nr:hypothetical protein [Ptychographa xylographoides]
MDKTRHNGIQRLHDLRDAVYGLRLKQRERRSELREERSAASESDARYMTMCRNAWQQGSTPLEEELEKAYADLVASRDRIGALQFEHDEAETEFDVIEAELEEVELSTIITTYPTMEESDGSISSESLSYLPQETQSSTELQEYEITLEQYQSRIGDANIIWERLQNMLYDYITLTENSRARKVVGKGNDIGTIQSLQDLRAAYSSTRQEFQTIETDVLNLREQAAVKGFFLDEKIWPIMPLSLSAADLGLDQSEVDSTDYTHRSDSILPDIRLYLQFVRTNVNKWILQRFANSPVDHIQHKTILQSLLSITMDDRTWARLVIMFWARDDKDQDWGSGASTPAPNPRMPSEETWIGVVLRDLLVSTEAARAVYNFERDFEVLGTHQPRLDEGRPWYPKERDHPYDAYLDLDIISDYESRSV